MPDSSYALRERVAHPLHQPDSQPIQTTRRKKRRAAPLLAEASTQAGNVQGRGRRGGAAWLHGEAPRGHPAQQTDPEVAKRHPKLRAAPPEKRRIQARCEDPGLLG